jgi:2-polyprenyl-6-methoxyphenol hydroxylase-like FAD-dependent oxidoreductase
VGAVIAGAGIGGLSGALARHRRGIIAHVPERDQPARAAGVALSLWPNPLQALDALDVGDSVRGHAALAGNSGIRGRDGQFSADTIGYGRAATGISAGGLASANTGRHRQHARPRHRGHPRHGRTTAMADPA